MKNLAKYTLLILSILFVADVFAQQAKGYLVKCSFVSDSTVDEKFIGFIPEIKNFNIVIDTSFLNNTQDIQKQISKVFNDSFYTINLVPKRKKIIDKKCKINHPVVLSNLRPQLEISGAIDEEIHCVVSFSKVTINYSYENYFTNNREIVLCKYPVILKLSKKEHDFISKKVKEIFFYRKILPHYKRPI